tara:strand:+ start:6285 stop:7265 length:981 start_codon:yes stop_codon:yes gene_type:complete
MDAKPSPTADRLICWTVTDGRRGIENQALGLAEAVAARLAGDGVTLEIQRATVRKGGMVSLPEHGPPDLWIGCGRAAISQARPHRGIFPNCFFTYIQDPRGHYREFDLIVAPAHDRLVGSNAIEMIGSPNRISAEKLADGVHQFAARPGAPASPRAAILIGGDSKRFRLTERIGEYLINRMEGLLAQHVGLMITTSRRTPEALAKKITNTFAGRERVWLYDGEGENPYFAFLGSADWIFVTEESTNMLVEACATGTPVYALPMDGEAGKFTRLHAALEARGAMRPYLGKLEQWAYEPLDETNRIAGRLIDAWLGMLKAGQANEAAA